MRRPLFCSMPGKRVPIYLVLIGQFLDELPGKAFLLNLAHLVRIELGLCVDSSETASHDAASFDA